MSILGGCWGLFSVCWKEVKPNVLGKCGVGEGGPCQVEVAAARPWGGWRSLSKAAYLPISWQGKRIFWAESHSTSIWLPLVFISLCFFHLFEKWNIPPNRNLSCLKCKPGNGKGSPATGGAWQLQSTEGQCDACFSLKVPWSLGRRKEWDQRNRSTMIHKISSFPSSIWDIYWVPPDLARISASSREVVWGRQDYNSRLCSIICTTGDLSTFPSQGSPQIHTDKGRDMYSWVSEGGICCEGVTRAQMLSGDSIITWLGDKRLPQGSIIDLTSCTRFLTGTHSCL